jgi:beta-1,2-mannobiose phosphorylase / 1,2-beta-oligomannan phosphorylase
MLTRHPRNPLIRPADVVPSRPDFDVIGAFNAGATTFGDEVLLLLRVAERPKAESPDVVLCPHLQDDGTLALERMRRSDPRYNTSDPRMVLDTQTNSLWLTSISHFRLARSKDGVNFTIDKQPWLQASNTLEGFGVEDARITCIDNVYYVNYSAVSRYGIATGLASTRDFVTVERHGVIFPPSNRDVTIFPQQIGGQYVCYHRPMPGMFGGLHIWIATSPDLVRWGDHRPILEGDAGGWDGGRVGGGAPPVYTDAGWLNIYHAADKDQRYCLGAFLTPHDDPARILVRSREPIFAPEADYETSGFFGNVVFSCGAVVQNGILRLYYGASDETIALAEAPLDEFLKALQAG